MNRSPAYILADDVELFSAADAGVRHSEHGDMVVDRLRSRHQAQLISKDTAQLISEFRLPSTVPEAIVRLCQETDEDPETALECALPVINSLIESGVLVPENNLLVADRKKIGNCIGGYEITRILRQTDDTEVYQLRLDSDRFAVYKCVASGAPELVVQSLAREAEITNRFQNLAPDVLSFNLASEECNNSGKPGFLMDWLDATPISDIAFALRQRDDRKGLAKLFLKLVRAVQSVHKCSLLHGDLRPSNILIDREDRVRLIDFSFATSSGKLAPMGRVFDLRYLEPRAAKDYSEGSLSALTEDSERYGLGVLLYSLATGAWPYELPDDQDAAIAFIASGPPPLEFASFGIRTWPQMEAILRRMMGGHSISLASVIEELEAVSVSVRPKQAVPCSQNFVNDIIRASSNESLDTLFPHKPQSCVHSGAGGLAYFLYRAALVRKDDECLALADYWQRIAAQLGSKGVWKEDKRGSGPWFDLAGLEALKIAIGLARNDLSRVNSGIESYCCVERPNESYELLRGYAGGSATAAWLIQLLEAHGQNSEVLRKTLRKDLPVLDRSISSWPSETNSRLGMAHGLAGIIYASISARSVLGLPLTSSTMNALNQIYNRSVPIGRGTAWPEECGQKRVSVEYAPGWCSGSAGFIMLLASCFRISQSTQTINLISKAAFNTAEHSNDDPGLCCGTSGRSLALVQAWHCTDDDCWLDAAERLASKATISTSQQGLFRGTIGPALAQLEVGAKQSTFPLV